MRLPSHHALLGALLIGMLAAAGCSRHDGDAGTAARTDAGKSDSGVHFNGGVTFSGDQVTLRRDNLPVAVITPAGDLKLDDRTVTRTDAQRQAMTAYRKQLQALTRQGIAVGKAGAQLGVDAASEAIKGIFNGDADKVGDKVEARADAIKQEALKLCDHIETLRVAQDAAVAIVPEFKPYAGLDHDDVTDCRN